MLSKRTPGPPGTRKPVIDAGAGQETVGGIFGVDAAFDGMADATDVGLAQGQAARRRRLESLANEIDAGDELGHRMLDLDARVHFDEIEIARRLVVEEFERAGAAIGNCSRQVARRRRKDECGSRSEDRRRGASSQTF